MQVHFSVFKKNYLVIGLPDEEIQKIVDLTEFGVAYPGNAIIDKGSVSHDLFVILDGTATVLGSDNTVLAERGPESVIGEIALIDNKPRSAHVIAKGTVSYAKLSGDTLRKYIGQNPAVGMLMLSNLARVLAMRLREASQTIDDLHGQIEDPWRFSGSRT